MDIDRIFGYTKQVTPDAAQLDEWTSQIIKYLRDVRVIVTRQKILSELPNIRELPIENLKNDPLVEVSFKEDRFKYIPQITRQTNIFINNRSDLIKFVTNNPQGTKYSLLSDAYRDAIPDIYQLYMDKVFMIISQAKTTKTLTSSTTTTSINALPEDEISRKIALKMEQTKIKNEENTPTSSMSIVDRKDFTPDDVVYPTSYVDTLGFKVELDEKYKVLWREVKDPQTFTEVELFLKQNNCEILPQAKFLGNNQGL